MAIDSRRFGLAHTFLLRDVRPAWQRFGGWAQKPDNSFVMLLLMAVVIYFWPPAAMFADLILLISVLYFWWLMTRDRTLCFKMPAGAPYKDHMNTGPGRNMKAEGIMYLGNNKATNEEVWFTNTDARTHILYLGTTGSGKTEGLKTIATNALTWGSGFIYIDGKADTDLWSSLSSLCRRFGRDDDLLVLNYMTGNSDARAPSNSMNPFSSGSASFLTNMLVSLMPEAEGDNAMWKERAVALLGAIMPALTWKRDNQDIMLSVSTIRDYLTLEKVIQLSRDEALPDRTREGVKGYLDTLPGYIDSAFDDEGRLKPLGPGQPPVDDTTVRQQHGYLTMQFTRSLQSLGDEYGYIFDTQNADVDMIDVVLNRRILVVLIPALEKSGDETANLGKIVAATLKGMMGSTLGANVEGSSETVIENKPTNSATPFVTIFDEVGYYTAQGMAVMAAQARSLGFSLTFAAQDLPSMQKRVADEAKSITGNCNIKIFGKLEDPTETKNFFHESVGEDFVMEVSGLQAESDSKSAYFDSLQAGLQDRKRANYDSLRAFKEGDAVVAYSESVCDVKMLYTNPGHAKAMRVTRYLALEKIDDKLMKHVGDLRKVRDNLSDKNWTAERAQIAKDPDEKIHALHEGLNLDVKTKDDISVQPGITALVNAHALDHDLNKAEEEAAKTTGDEAETMENIKGESGSSSESAKPKPQGDPSNPMSFFGGGESSATPTAPAQDTSSTPPAAAEPQQTQPAKTNIQPEKPVDFDLPPLDQETQSKMQDAGETLAKTLKGDNSEQAAE